MGIRLTVECDVCGIEKKQTNNWFRLVHKYNTLLIEALNYSEQNDQGSIICGEACMHKLIAQKLSMLHPPKENPNA